MGLETFLDKIKINKFAGCCAIVGMNDYYNIAAEVITKHNIDLSDIGIALMGTVCVASSIYFAKKQNQRYDGIVDKIEKNGYDDRFCSIYMDHPCGRSAVKVALKRTGHFDKYEGLKSNYPLTRIA